MSDVGSVEARLQRVEDLLEIQQLFVDYGRHLDAGDFGAYAKLFAEDGEVMLGPMGKAKGRQAVEELMTRALSGRAGQSYHLITSPTVNLDGDRAASEVMWTVVVRGADGRPSITMTGRHRDDLIRTDDGWKFQRRRGFVDIPSSWATFRAARTSLAMK